MSVIVSERSDSDDEYNELDDVGEDVQDGVEAAEALLAASTEQDAGVDVDLADNTAPAANDIVAVTSSAIKEASQPQPARLAANRVLHYDSQHTPREQYQGLARRRRPERHPQPRVRHDQTSRSQQHVLGRHEREREERADHRARSSSRRLGLPTGLASIAAGGARFSDLLCPGPNQPGQNVFDPNAERPSQQEITNEKMYDNI